MSQTWTSLFYNDKIWPSVNICFICYLDVDTWITMANPELIVFVHIYTYICMHDASLEFKPHLVNSEICSKKFWGSSSPSSCLSCTCSCSGSSASWHLWRCGTRPAPRDRWPRWSCSPSPPRTASSSGTWCCRSTPSDNARWPSHSPDGLRRRHLSRWTPNLRVGTTRVRFVNNWKPLSCFTRASAWKGKYDRMKYAVSSTNLISHNKKKKIKIK